MSKRDIHKTVRRATALACSIFLAAGLVPAAAFAEVSNASPGAQLVAATPTIGALGVDDGPTTISAPVEVSTPEGLAAIASDLSADYVLTADIDLEGVDWVPVGTSGAPFTGTLDGSGHKISNLSLVGSGGSVEELGLFGAIEGATVKDLALESCVVEASTTHGVYAGLVAAVCSGNAVLERVTVDDACSVTVNSTAYARAGSLVGYANVASMALTGCANAGRVSICSPISNVGGLVGSAYNCETVSLVDCSNTGVVSASGDVRFGYAGGILGRSVGTASSFTRCANDGDVTGSAGDCYWMCAGGITTVADSLVLEGCRNDGNVRAEVGRATQGLYSAGLAVGAGLEGSRVSGCTNGGKVVAEGSTKRYGNLDSGKSAMTEAWASGIVGYLDAPSWAVSSASEITFDVIVSACANTGDVASRAAHAYATGVCAICDGGIEDCRNAGRVDAGSAVYETSDAQAAGVVGGGAHKYSVSTSRLSNAGDVTAHDAGSAYAGGVCGAMTSAVGSNDPFRLGPFEDCSNTGAVRADGDSRAYAGGVKASGTTPRGIQERTGSAFVRCSNAGEVTAVRSNPSDGGSSTLLQCMAGGISPLVGGAIDCFNSGAVTANHVKKQENERWTGVTAGGIAAFLTESAVHCYDSGAVVSENGEEAGESGALVGSCRRIGSSYGSGFACEDCYWLDGAAPSAVGGSEEQPDGVARLSAQAMGEQVSFAGFDFDSVWEMPAEGADYAYPVLRTSGGGTSEGGAADGTGADDEYGDDALELDAADGSPSANGGISYSISQDGVLLVEVPSDGTMDATGVAHSTLRIPSELQGVAVKALDVKAIETGDTSSNDPKVSTLPKGIAKLELPAGIEEIQHVQLAGLREVSFTGPGKLALKLIANPKWTKANERGKYGSFGTCPSLERFNAGYVDGEWFDCVLPADCELGFGAFCGTSVRSVYIPTGVTSPSDGSTLVQSFMFSTSQCAFSYCERLVHVRNDTDTWFSVAGSAIRTGDDLDYRGTYKVIPASAFAGCRSLVELDIPDSVTGIELSAFSMCTSLEHVDLPDGLKTIGGSAFKGTAISELEVPDTVTYMGAACIGMTNISSLRLPAKLWAGYKVSNFNQDPVAGSPDIAASTSSAAGTDVTGRSGWINGGLHNLSLKSVDWSAYKASFVPPYMMAWASEIEQHALPSCVTQVCMGAFLDNLSLRKVASYAQTLDVAGFGQKVGDDELGWSEDVPSAVSYYNGYASYPKLEGIEFWGFGYSENKLVKFCDDYGYDFVPLAFLGKTGEGYDPVSLFGYVPSANTAVRLSSVSFDYEEGVAQVPGVEVEVRAAAGSRELEEGADYTVRYFDSSGAELDASEVVEPGTYELRVCGDGVSVFGDASASFRIAAPSNRIAGDSREATAAEVALAAFPSGARHAVLAYGWNFPDALSASALAGGLGAPILLTNSKGAVGQATLDALDLLGTAEVWIMGSSATIPDSTRDALAARLGASNVHRVAGSDRCNTAVAASNVLQRRGLASDTCILTNGWKFADAVSASPYAAHEHAPVFLTGRAGNIPKTTLSYMTARGEGGEPLYRRCVVLGDATSVSAAAEAQLEAAGIEVVRLAGRDRFETSAKIASFELSEGMACSTVALATGANAKGGADALSGGPLMGELSGPILLVRQAELPAAQSAWLESNAGTVGSLVVLGGEPSVSEVVVEAARAALERG